MAPYLAMLWDTQGTEAWMRTDDKGGWGKITIHDGLTQGDALSGGLFCIGLYGALQATDEEYKRKEAGTAPNRAKFQDDIVATCQSRDGEETIAAMKRDLESIGLQLNDKKCQILCDRDPRTRDKLCAQFGFKPAIGTMDILGGGAA